MLASSESSIFDYHQNLYFHEVIYNTALYIFIFFNLFLLNNLVDSPISPQFLIGHIIIFSFLFFCSYFVSKFIAKSLELCFCVFVKESNYSNAILLIDKIALRLILFRIRLFIMWFLCFFIIIFI